MEKETVAPATPTNKGGAPYGNQNARKHGFYSASLNDAERDALEAAGEIRGIDDEIALLRVKIQSLVRSNHGNVRLAIQATSALARLLKIRDSLYSTKQDRDEQATLRYYQRHADMLTAGEKRAVQLLGLDLNSGSQQDQESTDAQ